MAYSSEKGRNWLLKALDPSMTSVDVDGVPDLATDNVIMLRYNSQFQISAPSYLQANETWDADIYLFPHPVLFGSVCKYGSGWKLFDNITVDNTTHLFHFANNGVTLPTLDPAGPTTLNQTPVEIQTFLNTQVDESLVPNIPEDNQTRYQRKCRTMRNNVDGIRIAYGAVTLIPNVSSMFDSGVMVGTQQASHRNYVDIDNPGGNNNNTITNPVNQYSMLSGKQTDLCKVSMFDVNDFPTFENAVNNPHMLSTRFKNGIYMPYKIMNPQVHPFRNCVDSVFFATRPVVTEVTWAGQSGTRVHDANSVKFKSLVDQGGHGVTYTTAGMAGSADVEAACKELINCEKQIMDLSFDEINGGQVGIDLCGTNIMCICIRGIARQATFSLVFRMGFEGRVSAGTSYSMFKYISPNYDEEALKSYQNVVRQSKDAYVGDMEGSSRLRQALSSLMGIEPKTDEKGEMPKFVGSIGV